MPNELSAIDSLPIEAQNQIIAWLEVGSRRQVLARLAQPAPEGFGLQTHLTTLNRFYARHLARECAAHGDLAQVFAPAAPGDPGDAALQSLVTNFAFELATKPKRKIDAFKALSRWLLQRRELEQREREVHMTGQRLSLDRDKWEFDIAHRVLLHHAALDQIRRDPSTSDEEKIDRARSTLFSLPSAHPPAAPAPRTEP